jgi:hypothetical protein
MPDSSQSVARALSAVADAAQLIDLAQGAVERACTEVHGEAQDVAVRLSQQLQFLRNVAEVLRHEIERVECERALALTPPAIRDRSIS